MAATMNMLCWFPKRISTQLYRFAVKQHNHLRCSSTLTIQGDSEYTLEPEYPPVTPRWPPGKWGEMSEKTAWEFYEEAVKFQDTRILYEKLDALTDLEQIYCIVETDNSTPRILDFHKNVTKTAFVEGLPPMYENIAVDDEFKILKPFVIDGLVREYRAQFKDNIHDKKPNKQDREYSRRLVYSLADTIFAVLAGRNEHLMRSQIDRDARIECFWRKLLNKGKDPDCPDRQSPGVGKHDHLRLQLNHVAELMVRTEQPLPEVNRSRY
jgi:hypothetical protein